MTSHLGMVELSPVPPDTRRFWCAGVAADVLHAVGSAVELRGGKLAQVAHPIGWSAPGGEGVPWIEFRRTVAGAFSLSASFGAFPRAAIAARSTTSDRWYRALETSSVLRGGPPCRWRLIESAMLADEGEDSSGIAARDAARSLADRNRLAGIADLQLHVVADNLPDENPQGSFPYSQRIPVHPATENRPTKKAM